MARRAGSLAKYAVRPGDFEKHATVTTAGDSIHVSYKRSCDTASATLVLEPERPPIRINETMPRAASSRDRLAVSCRLSSGRAVASRPADKFIQQSKAT